MCVCMCVRYVYTYICVYRYTHICVYVYAYVHIYVCINIASWTFCACRLRCEWESSSWCCCLKRLRLIHAEQGCAGSLYDASIARCRRVVSMLVCSPSRVSLHFVISDCIEFRVVSDMNAACIRSMSAGIFVSRRIIISRACAMSASLPVQIFSAGTPGDMLSFTSMLFCSSVSVSSVVCS